VFDGAGDPTGLVAGGSTDVGEGAEDSLFAVGGKGSGGDDRAGGGALELRRPRDPERAGGSADGP
jgi:hypothetical protein